ncbi:MAG: hypothetical protein [Microviridae sp.]|nr:MAG: hypothetical protein [Microviridae sp.]
MALTSVSPCGAAFDCNPCPAVSLPWTAGTRALLPTLVGPLLLSACAMAIQTVPSPCPAASVLAVCKTVLNTGQSAATTNQLNTLKPPSLPSLTPTPHSLFKKLIFKTSSNAYVATATPSAISPVANTGQKPIGLTTMYSSSGKTSARMRSPSPSVKPITTTPPTSPRFGV